VFPLKDNIPVLRRPLAVWTIITLNVLMFFYEASLSERGLSIFLHLYGVVPARFTNPSWAAWAGYPDGAGETCLTYMFLHGGWLHLLLNMWALWIFADNIEDALGHFRFIVFYLVCGLAALAAHVAFNFTSTLPVVGASGAIAGIMGAYLRIFPHARVTAIIPIVIIPVVMNIPAPVFLVFWFLIQLFSGLFDSLGGAQASNVAFWAHAGGFAAGLLLVPFFLRSGGLGRGRRARP
jgi:membrane associated rhomboid family serine protease